MIWMKSLLHVLTALEPWLNILALLILLRAGSWKRFPAVTSYFGFRCIADAGLYFILIEQHFFAVSVQTQTLTYIYAYWACYLIGAVAIFFAIQEIFKAVLEPVPGLQRLGLIAFRWVSIATGVVLLGTTILPTHQYASGDAMLAAVGAQMVRCVSILEICLLAYLAISVHSLGRSFRGRVFGVGLGFGLQAAGEMICSLMYSKPGPIWSAANLCLEVAAISALAIWMVYFILPEAAEERGPITLPATSPLLRWNDIASALGQRPAHVSLGSASSAFFLQDVEQVVDKFLTKTS
jgi:hypothetical protein